MFIARKVPESKYPDLKKVFQEADANKNGFLDAQEVQNCF